MYSLFFIILEICNAYSETLSLYRSNIFCVSLYLWIPI
uniref:Photosystem II protein I n=1 Tax=Utricularia macrorhiza TaxID=192300 RepID=A0A097ZTC8_9LAMI|nr:photosystem II protein I [Utricularia macrorhiza]CDL78721.1 photosystem II protein I [Utricularia macrorhiza]